MLRDLSELRKLYEQGVNITETLRLADNGEFNTAEIIEVAYDLQAGSYIKLYQEDLEFSDKYTRVLADLLSPWITSEDSILDVGTGEMTTFGPVMSRLNYSLSFACDISLSRIMAGRSWLQQTFPNVHQTVQPFVADLASLPFTDKALDVTWSSHALEPNHGREEILVNELLRITNKVLILFEPHYESASSEAKERMRRLGYIRNLEDIISSCGGELLELVSLPVTANPLNHTHCFIVKPRQDREILSAPHPKPVFVCPVAKKPLDIRADGCIMSSIGLHAYPMVGGIPILRGHLAFPFTHPEYIESVATGRDLA